MSSSIPSLPVEIHRVVLSHLDPNALPAHDSPSGDQTAIKEEIRSRRRALATYMRTSKFLAALAAPLLYEHVHVPLNLSSTNVGAGLGVDTALSAQLVALPDVGEDAKGEEDGNDAKSNAPQTMKTALLRFVRRLTLDVTQQDVIHSDKEMEERHPDVDGQTRTSRTGLALPDMPNLAVLTLCLEDKFVTKHIRDSRHSKELTPIRPLENLAPKSLIIRNATLHQQTHMYSLFPTPNLVSHVYILVNPTPQGYLSTDTTLGTHSGLKEIFATLRDWIETADVFEAVHDVSPNDLQSSNLEAPSGFSKLISKPLHVSVVLKPPLPTQSNPAGYFRARDSVPIPHSGMLTTMEFNPDYAPGWLGGLTRLLGYAVYSQLEPTSMSSRSTVSFVNFDRLDGEEFGVPQIAPSELIDRFKRAIRVHALKHVSFFSGIQPGAAQDPQAPQNGVAGVAHHVLGPGAGAGGGAGGGAGAGAGGTGVGVSVGSDAMRAQVRIGEDLMKRVKCLEEREWVQYGNSSGSGHGWDLASGDGQFTGYNVRARDWIGEDTTDEEQARWWRASLLRGDL